MNQFYNILPGDKLIFGIRPTGHIHFGHISIIKKILHLSCKKHILIADIHALSNIKTNQNILLNDVMVSELISLGISTNDIIIQSYNTHLLYLSFLISCIVKHSLLKRMHLVKKQTDFYVSEYFYPILMAADIIVSQANYIVVGDDQKQHIELYQNIAKKLSLQTIAKPIYLPYILGTDGRKMSKSYNNTISPFHNINNIQQTIKTIPTGDSIDKTIFNIKHKQTIFYRMAEKIYEIFNIDYEKQLFKKEISFSKEKQSFFQKINDYIQNTLKKHKSQNNMNLQKNRL